MEKHEIPRKKNHRKLKILQEVVEDIEVVSEAQMVVSEGQVVVSEGQVFDHQARLYKNEVSYLNNNRGVYFSFCPPPGGGAKKRVFGRLWENMMIY